MCFISLTIKRSAVSFGVMTLYTLTILVVFFFYIYGRSKQASGLFVSRPSTMILENNEYKNVVIAIHESVPEDKNLLNTLKDTLTKASKYLYTATRQRAFFKEIKILLPSSWSNDALYAVPTTENLAFADVILTDPIRGKRSLPLTRSYDGCGKQGVHVLLTKEFLTMPRIEPYFNDPAKYFIHAFAQFRWGVFQEYAEEGEHEFYLSPTTGRPEPIKCTIMLRGLVQKNDSAHTICYLPSQAQSAHVIASVDNNTGLYESDCMWRPYPTRQRTKASLMDHQYIKELETFCDDNHTNYMTEHNFEAPSKHNRLCGHRSTWDVITNTDDFKGGKNPPRGLLDAQLQPTFIVLKTTNRKRRAAVLIDPAITNKFDVQQAVGRFKHEAPVHDIELRLIDNRTHTASIDELRSADRFGRGLQQHYKNDNRHFLEERIEETIQTFDDEGQLDNAHLIVVTDKHLNHIKPTLNLKRKGLKTSAVSFHSIGAVDDDNETGYHVVGKRPGHTVLDRLREAVIGDSLGTVIITREEMYLSRMKPFSSSVDFDPSLKRHITFIFHFERDPPYIDVRSPSYVIFDTESDVCTVDYDLNVIKFRFEFIEAGRWTYTVRQSSRQPQNVQLTIISADDSTKSDPVVIRPSIKNSEAVPNSLLLHVDVTQGSQPFINMNVTARIETPTGDTALLQLLDNGAGADISNNDGVYSRIYFPMMSGYHHVTFVVINELKSLRKEESFIVTEDENTPIRKLVSKVAIDGNIQREVSGGAVFIQLSNLTLTDVIVPSKITDVIAPSRITDLKAVRYMPYRNTIVLRWTAPGDDFDHGKPTSYQLFIGYGVRNIRAFLHYTWTGNFVETGHVARETIPAKTNATKTEILLWDVKVRAKSYIFAICAVDDSGNTGDTSNVAIAPAVLKQI